MIYWLFGYIVLWRAGNIINKIADLDNFRDELNDTDKIKNIRFKQKEYLRIICEKSTDHNSIQKFKQT